MRSSLFSGGGDCDYGSVFEQPHSLLGIYSLALQYLQWAAGLRAVFALFRSSRFYDFGQNRRSRKKVEDFRFSTFSTFDCEPAWQEGDTYRRHLQ